jgi:hypothetical protein
MPLALPDLVVELTWGPVPVEVSAVKRLGARLLSPIASEPRPLGVLMDSESSGVASTTGDCTATLNRIKCITDTPAVR